MLSIKLSNGKKSVTRTREKVSSPDEERRDPTTFEEDLRRTGIGTELNFDLAEEIVVLRNIDWSSRFARA